MSTAFLSLGANLEDPEAQIEAAIAALEQHPAIRIEKVAPLRTTKPWGKTDQPDFLNTAVAIDTSLSPRELLDDCLAIEAALGRERHERWGARLIDIDIIAYDRMECDDDGLVLPHPHAHERDFVLDPLREIAPEVAQWLLERQTKTS